MIDGATPLSLNTYAEPAVANTADANAGFGHPVTVANNPEYEEIYIYKVAGETFAAADTFDLGGVTYTVQNNGVTPGKYGYVHCLLYTSPSPRDLSTSRMPSSA